MTDPKDELGARFEDRRPDSDQDSGTDTSDSSSDVDNADNLGGSSSADNTSGADNSGNTGVSDGSSELDNSNNSNNTSGKPGPDRDEDATRHKRQVPMYLTEEKADSINTLYEQLDGRSKVAGNGGIEKHADFMETLVELAVENEDELAERLGIE